MFPVLRKNSRPEREIYKVSKHFRKSKYLSRTVQFNYLNYHYTYSTNYKLIGILPEYSNCCLALKPDRVTFMTSLIFGASMLQTMTSSSGVLVSLFIGTRETKDISGVH